MVFTKPQRKWPILLNHKAEEWFMSFTHSVLQFLWTFVHLLTAKCKEERSVWPPGLDTHTHTHVRTHNGQEDQGQALYAQVSLSRRAFETHL